MIVAAWRRAEDGAAGQRKKERTAHKKNSTRRDDATTWRYVMLVEIIGGDLDWL